MANKVVFSSVKQLEKVKNRDLEKDSEGYYKIPIGAINTYNSAGAFYKDDLGPASIFNESSKFMRRVRNGGLRAEVGHPKRLPGMSLAEYKVRYMSIYEDNICANIKSIEIVKTDTKEDPEYGNVHLIYGWVKPAGPRGAFLKEMLDDPDGNVAFSVRSVTNDELINGVVVKVIKEILSFDFVNEPGIKYATKWKSYSMESVDAFSIDVTSSEDVEEFIHDIEEHVSTESAESMEIVSNLKDILHCKHGNNCHVYNW